MRSDARAGGRAPKARVPRGPVIQLALVCFVILVACSATTRYKVLSTIFDGVPAPGEAEEALDHQGASDSSGSGATVDDPDAELRKEPRTYFHAPYREHQCTACHDLTSGTLMLRAEKNELCLKCHAALVSDAPFVHGPVSAGACLLCHHPHKSSIRHLLLKPADELCSTCHSPDDRLPGPHHTSSDPSVPLACTSCHEPHTSSNRFFVSETRSSSQGAKLRDPGEPSERALDEGEVSGDEVTSGDERVDEEGDKEP